MNKSIINVSLSNKSSIKIDKIESNKSFGNVDLSIYKGKDGYTPQKGIDYFTEEDIESLKEIFALKDHIENHPASGTVTTNVHVSNNPPENESLTAWIDTSDDEEFMKNVSDLVLDEFRSIFSTMKEQITALRVKNSELEARIYYLELYGGGNSGVTNGDILVLEDKTILTLEDGTVLTFE